MASRKLSSRQSSQMSNGDKSGPATFLSAALCVILSLTSLCDATPQEGVVLLGLMKSWGVQFRSWVATEDPCQGYWEGITCSAGHVTAINLTNHGLSGGIPSSISQLTYLQSLDLSNNLVEFTRVGPWNTLTGSLPSELGSLQALETLNLNYLELSIQFPAVVLKLKNLVTLNMGNANLTGTIPDELGQLSRLQTLWLSNNSFEGPVPSAIGTLKDLRSLSLSYIIFDSPLPDNIGNLSELVYMNMHDSKLWGGLPASFGQLKKLQKLLLYDNELTGFIPDQWQGMTSLQQLALHKNYLSGSVPRWLLLQPNITELRLEQNQFQGIFPSLFGTEHFTRLNLQCNYFFGPYPNASLAVVDGNCFTNITEKKADNSGRVCQRNLGCEAFLRAYPPGTCAPCPPSNDIVVVNKDCTCSQIDHQVSPQVVSSSSKFPIALVLGGVFPLALAVLLGTAVAFFIWKRRRDEYPYADVFSIKASRAGSSNGGETDCSWEVPNGVRRYSFQELQRATHSFNSKHEIGVGGFGKVFLGTLEDGKVVAIKRASTTSVQGLTEFYNEISLLSRLHHRHLVRLEGFCDDRGLQILVYEYVKNGNLFSLLLGKRRAKHLHWYKRLEIAVGVAQGLEYLHSYADPPVIHRDVKPQNILLDENFTPKLCDFGISRANLDTHISTRPAGTAGYLDPQYFIQRHLTAASDVYGFGMVLLELVTGQKAIDHERTDGFNLVEWARPRFQSDGIESIVDPSFGEYPKETLCDMADIALKCTTFESQARPSMKVVLSVLEAHIPNAPSHVPTPSTSFSLPAGESFTDILYTTEAADSFKSLTDTERELLWTESQMAIASDVVGYQSPDDSK